MIYNDTPLEKGDILLFYDLTLHPFWPSLVFGDELTKFDKTAAQYASPCADMH